MAGLCIDAVDGQFRIAEAELGRAMGGVGPGAVRVMVNRHLSVLRALDALPQDDGAYYLSQRQALLVLMHSGGRDWENAAVEVVDVFTVHRVAGRQGVAELVGAEVRAALEADREPATDDMVTVMDEVLLNRLTDLREAIEARLDRLEEAQLGCPRARRRRVRPCCGG